jgi:ABC-type transport system substrate-binding protein
MGWDLDFYQLWHSSQADEQGGSNHCGFKNAEVDRLAVELRATFEEPQRIAICQRIQAIIHEEQPYTFFRSAEGIFTWKNRAPAGDHTAGRWLGGVTEGLDRLHPLKNRTPLFWHILPAQ